MVDSFNLTRSALAALNDAALAIAGELSLRKVLQQIVDVARELTNAQYAALGVPTVTGRLEMFIHSGISAEQVARMPHLPTGEGLLGALVYSHEPIRLPRLQDDPRSVGFPDGHPDMDSFLGVPILAGGDVLGTLYLTNKQDAEAFSHNDEVLVQMFAAHAAIAIQNARLYEQVERLAVLEERTRLGMDLHDGVIQSIYAVGLTLESTRLTLANDPDESAELLGYAIDGLNGAIQDIRNFIMDLRPRRFQGDLGQGLAQLVREFQANTMVPVTLTFDDRLNRITRTMPTAAARTVFLTTQEALANAARHAKASHVDVQVALDSAESTLELIITDDGRGFNVVDSTRRIGHGLANMQARASDLNGNFDVESQTGHGTRIILTLPLR
jgi:signal transduction histidine kinase